MKPYLLASLATAGLLAQTALTPVKVDWRYDFVWSDPNPPSDVDHWTVYASNSPSNVRIMQAYQTTSVSIRALLLNAPAGAYALFNTATSTTDDISDPSTNLWIRWPGGDGKIKPGKDLEAHK